MAKKSRKINGTSGSEVSITFIARKKKDLQAILDALDDYVLTINIERTKTSWKALGTLREPSPVDPALSGPDKLPVWADVYINNFVERHNLRASDDQQITRVQVLREALMLFATANRRDLEKRDIYEKE